MFSRLYLCLMTCEWPQKWWAAGMPWPSWANTGMMCSPQSHCSRALLFSWIRKSPCQSCQLFVHSLCRSQSPQGFGFLTPNHSGSRSQINSLFTTHLNIFWEKWNVALLLFIANNLKDWCLGWSDYLSLEEKDISLPWEMDEERELCSTIVILNLTLSTCGRR